MQKYVNIQIHSIKMEKCPIFAAVFHKKNTKEVLSCLFVELHICLHNNICLFVCMYGYTYNQA